MSKNSETRSNRSEETGDAENPQLVDLEADRRKLADRLRQVREFLGLSQQEAATGANLTRLALSAIETGRRRVESVELQALARVYRQPVTYFLEEPAAGDSAADVQFLARAAKELSSQDRSELLRFAQFLKGYRSKPDPKSGSDRS